MRGFLLLVLIIASSCSIIFQEKKYILKSIKLKNFSKKQCEKLNEYTLNKQNEREEIPNSYSLISQKVNELKTTWKATTYKRDYKPLLGAILNGLEGLPQKKFKQRNSLPLEYDLRTAYPKCESLREVRDQANCGSCWAFFSC